MADSTTTASTTEEHLTGLEARLDKSFTNYDDALDDLAATEVATSVEEVVNAIQIFDSAIEDLEMTLKARDNFTNTHDAPHRRELQIDSSALAENVQMTSKCWATIKDLVETVPSNGDQRDEQLQKLIEHTYELYGRLKSL